MKRPLTRNWAVLFTSVDKRYIWVYLSYWCHLWYIIQCTRCGTLNKKKNTGEAIVQIRSSHDELTNTDRIKQPQDSHQVNSKTTRQFNIVWSELTNCTMQGSDYETQCNDNSPPGHLNQMSQKVRLSQLFVIGSNI